MRQIIPFITGALTLTAMWRAGSRKTDAWAIGLVNQVFWGITIVVFGVWGLAPLTIALTFIYSRNLLLWRRSNDERPT